MERNTQCAEGVVSSTNAGHAPAQDGEEGSDYDKSCSRCSMNASSLQSYGKQFKKQLERDIWSPLDIIPRHHKVFRHNENEGL